jgi:hypothetical protein
MIEHLFYLSSCLGARSTPPSVLPRNDPKIASGTRNKTAMSGVYSRMKRVTPNLLVATLRTGFAVAIALVLILVLLPAMLAAQASGLR